MADQPPPPPTRAGAPDLLDHTEEGLTAEERVRDREDNTVVIPEDGHGWKKYGQKFIKTIRKTRSYFRCHKMKCNAKKRVEWSASNKERLQITYLGVHTHPLIGGTHPDDHQLQASSASSRVNYLHYYDLYTQVCGDHQNNSNHS